MADLGRRETLARIRELSWLAVLRGPSAERTLQVVDALVAGGATGIEITYTTPDAAQVVRTLESRYGDRIVLGMGTLTKPTQAEEAKAAGARFLVSPHCVPELVEAMVATGLAVVVGALTPTEVELAHRLGADIVKVFPGSLVGPTYLRDLHGPFPGVPLMPSGGVCLANVGEWLAAGAVAVGVGGGLCPSEWIAEGRFDAITERACEFCRVIQEARGRVHEETSKTLSFSGQSDQGAMTATGASRRAGQGLTLER
jgi:2-dehydro-3-deoxyphosphogluconate aldolase/(4S)-4-hydroxy-2-oxoglutarate aldolase